MFLSDEQQQSLLNIARATIRQALGDSGAPQIEVVDPVLKQPAGCFVTLHESANHRLRGCIGRMDASLPLDQCVRLMSQGTLDDPRFVNYRVKLGDLPRLDLEISVLSPLTEARTTLDFDPAVHGIYLTLAGRTGVFLPQVAKETGWGKEQLLDRLCSGKMGLAPRAWQSGGRLQTFTCLVIGPVRFEG